MIDGQEDEQRLIPQLLGFAAKTAGQAGNNRQIDLLGGERIEQMLLCEFGRNDADIVGRKARIEQQIMQGASDDRTAATDHDLAGVAIGDAPDTLDHRVEGQKQASGMVEKNPPQTGGNGAPLLPLEEADPDLEFEIADAAVDGARFGVERLGGLAKGAMKIDGKRRLEVNPVDAGANARGLDRRRLAAHLFVFAQDPMHRPEPARQAQRPLLARHRICGPFR